MLVVRGEEVTTKSAQHHRETQIETGRRQHQQRAPLVNRAAGFGGERHFFRRLAKFGPGLGRLLDAGRGEQLGVVGKHDRTDVFRQAVIFAAFDHRPEQSRIPVGDVGRAFLGDIGCDVLDPALLDVALDRVGVECEHVGAGAGAQRRGVTSVALAERDRLRLDLDVGIELLEFDKGLAQRFAPHRLGQLPVGIHQCHFADCGRGTQQAQHGSAGGAYHPFQCRHHMSPLVVPTRGSVCPRKKL